MDSSTHKEKIDKSKINPPVIRLTDRAQEELRLIFANDYTLEGKGVRVVVSSKGCDGFTFSVGMSDPHPEDFVISAKLSPEIHVPLLVDPFAAYCFEKGFLDFVGDYANNSEGFVAESEAQKKYKGKFWRKDPKMVPPTAEA